MGSEEVRMQRLRWKSPWLQLEIPFAVMGLWCLLHQLWNGFLLLSTIAGVLLLCVSLPIFAACVQTVQICDGQVQLRLGPVALRQFSVSSVKALIGTSVSLGKGGSCREDLIILALQSPEKVIPVPQKFLFSYFPLDMGLWVSYSSQRKEQLQKLFPNVKYYAT